MSRPRWFGPFFLWGMACYVCGYTLARCLYEDMEEAKRG